MKRPGAIIGGGRGGAWPVLIAVVAAAGLGACGTLGGGPHGKPAPYRSANLKPYEVDGRTYHPKVYKRYDQEGLASWYDYPPGQRRTATGEPFDGRRMTAAHKTLPLPCVVEVTNLENGKKVRVKVNDRGPFVSGRIIDLSPAAADRLGFTRQGVAHVRVKLLGRARVTEADEEIRLAELAPAGDAGLQPVDSALY